MKNRIWKSKRQYQRRKKNVLCIWLFCSRLACH